MVKQALFILILSAALALAGNLVSPNKIPFIGAYRDLSSGDGPIVPPSADKGDPPFIAVDVAQLEFSLGKVLFVDARTPEEFECGTIPGSVNLPFEHLPEEGLDRFIDSCLSTVAKERGMIIFCSGEECDASLHLARNLQALGYGSLSIFFGGAREWEKFGMEMERRKQCE